MVKMKHCQRTCILLLVVLVIGWICISINYRFRSNIRHGLSDIYENVINKKTSTCCAHEFCRDNVPPGITKTHIEGPIHFCIAAGKAEVVRELEPLIKTLVLHAKRTDLFLHILTGNGSDYEIRKILNAIPDIPVQLKYELVTLNTDFILDETLKINLRITHHSGVWGMSKLYMYQIFNNVDKCIVLDTDIVFGTDPAFLWDLFMDQEDQQLISMRITNDMTESYMSNSGLMLQDFSRMRQMTFTKFYQASVKWVCSKVTVCSDQEVLFGLFKTNGSYLFRTLPVSWNLELCHDFFRFSFESYLDRQGRFFGGAHFNCAGAENKALELFTAKDSASNLRDYVKYLIAVPIQDVCSVM
ncbi:hypothetical protein ACJMK2_013331 [Sinanodonta woodiana]|uniref:Glycosyltransferase n=1 Tax=Sinanodonta woodiana TaxID=1069815 RepID=A0ABD3UX72_SINWO